MDQIMDCPNEQCTRFINLSNGINHAAYLILMTALRAYCSFLFCENDNASNNIIVIYFGSTPPKSGLVISYIGFVISYIGLVVSHTTK